MKQLNEAFYCNENIRYAHTIKWVTHPHFRTSRAAPRKPAPWNAPTAKVVVVFLLGVFFVLHKVNIITKQQSIHAVST